MTLLFAAATGALAQDAVLPSKTYKFAQKMRVQEFRQTDGRRCSYARSRDAKSTIRPASCGSMAAITCATGCFVLVRGKVDYTINFQTPEERFLQYVVHCENAMRSLQFQ